MKTVFSLLICLFSLSFFFGCGETDPPAETIVPRQSSMVPIPSLDIKYYPTGWVRLTDSDVEELLTFKFRDDLWQTKDPELLEKYFEAEVLKTHGDTPHVRFYIEYRRNKVSTPEIGLAFARTVYFLWPNEHNKKFVDEVIKNLPEYEDHADFEGGRTKKGTIEDLKERHVALLEKHGDIPEVQIVIDFEMKVRDNQPLTIDELFAYRQALFKLEPDRILNRLFLEAYLQAKANGQPLESVDERKILEEWRKDQEE
ncbi:MAG: hypothetical protein OXI63_01355 [Candidatus Poribacteria bacterium]|nr:hypothetical protein [Candidatus Poribacteria bacterium]